MLTEVSEALGRIVDALADASEEEAAAVLGAGGSHPGKSRRGRLCRRLRLFGYLLRGGVGLGADKP